MSDSLHPFGRCTCAGEGRCLWCIQTRIDEEVQQERDDVVAHLLGHAAGYRHASLDSIAHALEKKADHIRRGEHRVKR